MMRPRPFGSGVASAAAAEASVGAGCRGGWAWRPRPRARPGQRVRVRGTPSPHAAAAASAVHAEPHHGVRFRPFGLPREGFGSDLEAGIEKVIYACRFMAFLAIAGSLAGSVLCFLKGCTFVMDAFVEYYLRGDGKVVLMLIEAIDMYLIGTVMFVFGTGLYELFISNMDIAKQSHDRSSLFGLFKLPERPKWLEIRSVSDLKTKLGHVIVLVLLVGISEKSKRVTITSCTDLFCFAGSIFLSSGCLYLLSKLGSTKGGSHA
ncbi:hypothetical protein D1007_53813 [Hordeum vulgare]|uniref:Predicted protein n=1 Tax=Hordeum vulgare subsp. vulgare TaxID=112509 RepID=F2CQG8_HORVV|nr:uncharacterized protein LOC123412242 [Hordeum vulgare subsp. vulgare]KAE8773888.1 hypothetical protein D1007_53813 [Hordeum vulgare]BAJ85089.1 predicted protein [Hordeum vulgare subsp. vulgare]BAJ95370.1 predicted protein [Hordeum vulgare subsp. vulgare]